METCLEQVVIRLESGFQRAHMLSAANYLHVIGKDFYYRHRRKWQTAAIITPLLACFTHTTFRLVAYPFNLSHLILPTCLLCKRNPSLEFFINHLIFQTLAVFIADGVRCFGGGQAL